MSDSSLSPRDRILHAAAGLLASGGRESVSTRSVSAAAGVQPQTIYRQYGDMQGLLNAVARYGFGAYLESKSSAGSSDDAIADFRHGWDLHTEFALANPALYSLMYGDPRPGTTAATDAVEEVLGALLNRVALSGRLLVSVEHAIQVVLAANVGSSLALLSMQAQGREVKFDSELSVTLREMVIATLMSEQAAADVAVRDGRLTAAMSAAALGASLPSVEASFTVGERTLLAELLKKIQ